MDLFFEESGRFKVAHILSQVGDAFQVEHIGGKRGKVRAKDVLFQFNAEDDFLNKAQELAATIELDFLWEVAGENEFDYVDLAQEYFGHTPTPLESAALLLALHNAPVYFYKKGKGRYKSAPEQALKAALLSIEKKKQLAIKQKEYVEMLKGGQLPEELKDQALAYLVKPDKNGLAYKSFQEAAEQLKLTPERLLLHIKAVPRAKELHRNRFVYEYFPLGIGFNALTKEIDIGDLPLSNAVAFSVDDVETTEIDDAMSVTKLSETLYKIGVHIAAPGIGIKRGDDIDQVAKKRLSTVYMPGEKIPMLPKEMIEKFSLDEKQTRAAVSVYATFDIEKQAVVEIEHAVEKIVIQDNLRSNSLDELIKKEDLEAKTGDFPYKEEFAILWQFTKAQEAIRQEKRKSFGLKPEQNNRAEFNFYVDENEHVRIEKRNRESPLNKIVAQCMVFANATWAKLLTDKKVSAIFRTQKVDPNSWGNRLLVKMSSHPDAHQGLGVDQYVWATSPLRRYTDLINQWQIISCINGINDDKVKPIFDENDAELFAIMTSFESVYTMYSEFQRKMENYWCLRWLEQENIKTADALVLKDDLVRLKDIPFIVKVSNLPTLARGTQVVIEIEAIDDVELSAQGKWCTTSNVEITDTIEE